MTQEEKSLLLQDLCARLPYNVKCSVYDGDVKIDGVLCNYERISTDDILLFGLSDKVYNPPNKYYQPKALYRIESIRPYLRPMSSMTKDELKEFQKLRDITSLDWLPFAHDWLLSKHFDVRNLIPKGLGIDCTNLNIY